MRPECKHLGGEIATRGGGVVIRQCNYYGLSCTVHDHKIRIPNGLMRTCDACPAFEERYEPKLSICVTTFRDYLGVWTTVQSIQIHHQEVFDDIEFLVIDGDPESDPNTSHEDDDSSKCRQFIEAIGGKYIHGKGMQAAGAAKSAAFTHASGRRVLVVDGHTLFPIGALAKLIEWYEANDDDMGLIHGPLLGEDGRVIATHTEAHWESLTFGQLATMEMGDIPIEIRGQGIGPFACRRNAWIGFHPRQGGFGTEDVHIQARFQRSGRKNWLMPFLQWSNPIGNSWGAKAKIAQVEEFLSGYLVSHFDTGIPDLEGIRSQFVEKMKAVSANTFDEILTRTKEEFEPHRLTGMQRAASFVMVTASTVLSTATGGGYLSEQDIQARLDICNNCDKYQNGSCRLCGCVVNREREWSNKLAHPTAMCPDHPRKW